MQGRLRSALIGIALSLAAAAAGARTLPLPDTLISLASEQGEHLLLESEARESYWPLSIYLETQQNGAYCGVASIVIVLNALGIEAPATPEHAPYRMFTQTNVLNSQTEAVVPQTVLLRQGMTLDQIGGILEVYGVAVSVHHAADSSVDAFRLLARQALATPGHYVIVNYLRSAIGQERGGHISPLAAYDADSDRFLILDVSRYKYPPVWVATEDLFRAMNTMAEPDALDSSRGFVLIAPVVSPQP
ncbi:phytochelatin synthase family protein [Defluviicoccus vanus]|uniref:glutathione gamma-glutamylcysteinyltransferase n=1 Tax=Defluviicoccus vanus TaxID=111831 RepID=A0A7H1MYT0_9PROT|nr:phytochelatin synthase family protein [Defluviicoccus vanus]QNT68616.1 glutathione gamma-glutamylcysteinyltransferase [Defluviicoccus vanus]